MYWYTHHTRTRNVRAVCQLSSVQLLRNANGGSDVVPFATTCTLDVDRHATVRSFVEPFGRSALRTFVLCDDCPQLACRCVLHECTCGFAVRSPRHRLWLRAIDLIIGRFASEFR